MAVKLDPPFKTQMFMSGGFLSKAWEFFFRDLINRQEIVVDNFQTNGTLKEFQLSVEPRDIDHTMIFVNGSYVRKYAWDGATSKWVPNYFIEALPGSERRKNLLKLITAPASGSMEVITYGR